MGLVLLKTVTENVCDIFN